MPRRVLENNNPSVSSFERGLAMNPHKLKLELYVSGTTFKSIRAIANLKEICDQYLQGRYELKVVDIYKDVLLAKKRQIVAVPTLMKMWPAPRRMLVGDLSDKKKVLRALGVRIEV